MIHALEIAVSLIFFANKVFVLIGKKTGWLFGTIAAFLCIFYFYLIDLPIFTVFEIGLVVLMAYGFLKGKKKNEWVENGIRIFLALVMIALAIFAFRGLITAAELIASLLMLIATFFLAYNRLRLGWIIQFLAHIPSIYIGYEKNQLFFAHFQIASIIVALAGIVQGDKKRVRTEE